MAQAEEARMQARRLTGADFVRSLACLGVLIHHLAQKLDPMALPPFWRPMHTTLIMGAFGVSAFFVLSGYLLARPFWQALDAGHPMPSLKTYFMRRFARIAPGFWAALTVSFVLSFAVFGVKVDFSLVLRYLAGLSFVSGWHWLTLFPVETNGPLWSIGFEVTSYVLLPAALVLLFFGRRFGLRGWPARFAWIGALALALGVHALIQSVVHIGSAGTGWQYGLVGGAREWVPEYNPIGYFAIFAIGALAGGVEVALTKRHGFVFDLIFVAGAALAVFAVGPAFRTGIAEGWGWLGIPYAFPLFPIGIGTMLAAGPSTVGIGRITEAAPFRFIALISFGIYIWHYLVLELMNRLLFPYFHFGGVRALGTWLGLSAMAIAISLVCGWLSYRLIEAPALAWERRRENQRRSSAEAVSPA